jgi:hypothetical protein
MVKGENAELKEIAVGTANQEHAERVHAAMKEKLIKAHFALSATSHAPSPFMPFQPDGFGEHNSGNGKPESGWRSGRQWQPSVKDSKLVFPPKAIPT